MKNLKEKALAKLKRIENGEFYADDELDFLIEKNIPKEALVLPAALSVVELPQNETLEEDSIILEEEGAEKISHFREALRRFASEEAGPEQHKQLLAPISVNNSLHFAGLHVKRNDDNKTYTATYVDPIGTSAKPTYRLATTTISKKPRSSDPFADIAEESSSLFTFKGLFNATNKFLGLSRTDAEEEALISLQIPLPHSSIPFHIINALELELGIAPQEIILTSNKIQHPSNGHCGAFTAEILTSLATGAISVSETDLVIDGKRISDLDADQSKNLGSSLRENHAEFIKEYYAISETPSSAKAPTDTKQKHTKNKKSKDPSDQKQPAAASTFFTARRAAIGIGLIELVSKLTLVTAQGGIRTKTPTSSPTSLSVAPSLSPSALVIPTFIPTKDNRPSDRPSGKPIGRPTGRPSSKPVGQPSGLPSGQPSGVPTEKPSQQLRGSSNPSGQPTTSGTEAGTTTGNPTTVPTAAETSNSPAPSAAGTPGATVDGTSNSTEVGNPPSGQPSSPPSMRGDNMPSSVPTDRPSTLIPSRIPSQQPTSFRPSFNPTTQQPSLSTFTPTALETIEETRKPTSALDQTVNPTAQQTAGTTTRTPTTVPTAAETSNSPAPSAAGTPGATVDGTSNSTEVGNPPSGQ
ncbi:MAG: hypothetical protein KA100_05315, partial [Rickettsiales bacterium]|nr:hypothetical protein [Rickettsiales bacterium]